MGPDWLSFFSESGGFGGVRSVYFFCALPESSPPKLLSVLSQPEKVPPKLLVVLSPPVNVPLKSLAVLSPPVNVPPKSLVVLLYVPLKLLAVLPPVKDRKVVYPWVDPAGLSPALT